MYTGGVREIDHTKARKSCLVKCYKSNTYWKSASIANNWMGEPLNVGHVILVPMCLHPHDERKKLIGNHPLLEKLPLFSPWSMAVKSKVVTIDVTFMMLLVLQLLQWFELKPKETMPRSSCGQRPAFFSQASEDAACGRFGSLPEGSNSAFGWHQKCPLDCKSF